jgi:hypothetical protein
LILLLLQFIKRQKGFLPVFAGGILLPPFIFPFMGLVLFLATFCIIERKRFQGRRRKALALADLRTESMAQFLFEKNNSPVSADERIEWALRAAVKKLEVDFVILQVRTHDCSTQWNYYSSEEEAHNPLIFQIPFSETYCSSMSDSKSNLCIDFAGVSAWQNHPAFRKHCWEVYLGARGKLLDEQSCSIGFYQKKSMGKLFTKSERDFVHHLLLWVMAILNRENILLAGMVEGEKFTNNREKEEVFKP